MIQRLCRKSIQRWVNEKAAIILAVVVLYKKSYFSVVQLSNLTHAWCWYIQGQIKTFYFVKVHVNLSVKNKLLIGVLLNCWCMSPSQYLSATVSYLLTRDQEFLDHLKVFLWGDEGDKIYLVAPEVRYVAWPISAGFRRIFFFRPIGQKCRFWTMGRPCVKWMYQVSFSRRLPR